MHPMRERFSGAPLPHTRGELSQRTFASISGTIQRAPQTFDTPVTHPRLPAPVSMRWVVHRSCKRRRRASIASMALLAWREGYPLCKSLLLLAIRQGGERRWRGGTSFASVRPRRGMKRAMQSAVKQRGATCGGE